jgi:hypothetical protein
MGSPKRDADERARDLLIERPVTVGGAIVERYRHFHDREIDAHMFPPALADPRWQIGGIAHDIDNPSGSGAAALPAMVVMSSWGRDGNYHAADESEASARALAVAARL